MERKHDRTFKTAVKRVINEIKSRPRAPIQLRKEIYSYVPDECSEITSEGKRCSKAFNYIDKQGYTKDCVKYCASQCDKWVNDIIDKLPVRLTIGQMNFNVKQIMFIFYKSNQRGKSLYHIKYLVKNNEWKINSDIEMKINNIKSALCNAIATTNKFQVIIRVFDTYGRIPYQRNKEIDNVSLLDDQGNRWFTPKWKFISYIGNDTLEIGKTYLFT
jgi:hypothetical protein